MDTTKENIKMCEMAEEIQKAWKLQRSIIGDFYAEEIEGKYCALIHTGTRPIERNPLYRIWLPRQDQLQKMLDVNTGYWLVRLLKVAYSSTLPGEYSSFPFPIFNHSMEKLGLCVVMKEKYNKEWNGSEWIQEQNNE